VTKITKRLVDSLQPKTQPYCVWDAAVAGLGVRVQPTGSMSYVLKYWAPSGRQRWAKLGAVGILTPQPPGDLPPGHLVAECQVKNFAHLAHRDPLCWHSILLRTGQKERPYEPAGERFVTPRPRAASSRNPGRHHLGMVADIISERVGGIIPEWWAASPGIRKVGSRSVPQPRTGSF
jgi:hypothetical protein